jgi:hypothetical protein
MRLHHKGNIKFLNPLLLQEAYQMRGDDLLKRRPSLEENPHLLQQHILK